MDKKDKMAQNGQNWTKQTKMDKNGQKWTKMDKNGQNELTKMTK